MQETALTCRNKGSGAINLILISLVLKKKSRQWSDKNSTICTVHCEGRFAQSKSHIYKSRFAQKSHWSLCLAGSPVAWKLLPYPSPPMYALPASSHATRGGFANHQLWVTPYSEDEFWPAGMHPYARGRNAGLPEWTQQVCSAPTVNQRWHVS